MAGLAKARIWPERDGKKCSEMSGTNRPLSSDPLDRHVVAVNSSPLEKGHSLVVPAINRCFSQVLTEVAVRIATDLMLLFDDDSFHVLFNSLLGQASKCEHVMGDIYVIRRPNWFISTIIFQPEVSKCADFLSSKEVAHNIFLSRAHPLRMSSGEWSEDRKQQLPLLVAAYILPRVSIAGAKPAVSFNPVTLELAGCLTAYTYRFFETISE
ncbi:unnamed protein product [Toxocara canis]|uniref:GDP-D-glucose phosphorylase 1 n=1 Tax=Toxocara canis TaxID=6265 RepID=A0A183TWK0_TOXCA|nr:unnamed protein product [Toxocara canis]